MCIEVCVVIIIYNSPKGHFNTYDKEIHSCVENIRTPISSVAVSWNHGMKGKESSVHIILLHCYVIHAVRNSFFAVFLYPVTSAAIKQTVAFVSEHEKNIYFTIRIRPTFYVLE